MIRAMAALQRGAPLVQIEYEHPVLRSQEIEIAVSYCGVCHSDLSMIENEWGMTHYPLVAGHEIVGIVVSLGRGATRHKIGDRVGLGWFSESCMSCLYCMSGDHNLCLTHAQTIVNRNGGFATHVSCHEAWALPLPSSLAASTAGPLFCAGITVFNPLLQLNVSPIHKVGVIGLGGLGHIAIQFLNKWGCEVTAFTRSPEKESDLKKLGAHAVIDTHNPAHYKRLSKSLDFIISTVNAQLDWKMYLSCLAPKGKLHLVGAILNPIPVEPMALIDRQRTVSGSPLGSPANCQRMLDFCARHSISPITEEYPLSKVNNALERLKSGNVRYRAVLKNDLAI